MRNERKIGRRGFLTGAGVLGLAGLTAGSLSACTPERGGQTGTTPSAAGNNGHSVLTQFPTLDNVYWQGWNSGAEAAAQSLGIPFDTMTYSDSIEQQLSSIEGAGAQGVDMIMMFAQNAEGSSRLIESAESQGISVVNYITAAPWQTPLEPRFGNAYTALLAPNDVAGAEAMCTAIFDRLGGSGKIINLNGIPGNPTATARTRGCDLALEKFPGIEMVARENGGENRVASQPVIENLLTAHPDVDAVVCHNDDSALAVVNALRSRGMTDVLVGGNDGLEEFLDAIVQGPNAAATIAIHGSWLGGYGVVRAFDGASGVEFNPVERMMYHDSLPIDTPEAASAYIEVIHKASTSPFDYQKMSRALHPTDWDPQVALAPIDPRELWPSLGSPKPNDYSLPAEYQSALDGDAFETHLQMYKAAVKSSPLNDIIQLTTSKSTVLG